MASVHKSNKAISPGANPNGPESESTIDPDSGTTHIDEDEQKRLIERHEAEVAANQAPASRRLEQAIAICLVVICLLGLYESQSIVLRNHVSSALLGPRWWPTVLCLISLTLASVLTAIAFIRLPFERDGIEKSTRTGWFRAAATIVIEGLFIAAWMASGNFYTPAFVMLLIMLWLYGLRSWKTLIAFPASMIIGIYLVFDLLLKVAL